MRFENKPIINTDRLCLHFIHDNDREDMIALFTNKEISKTFMMPDFKSYDEKLQLFEALKTMSVSDEHFVYGIYLNNKMIGFINDVDSNETEVELGYVIAPGQENKGYATEVLRTAIQIIFRCGCLVVKAGAFEDNFASIRVMEKCGMIRTEQENNIEYRGKKHRCVYYKKEKDLSLINNKTDG